MITITEWIGIYGAVVATGVFVWDVIKNRPRIKIEMWSIKGSKDKDYTVTVVITNKSDYPTKLDYYGFSGKVEGKGGTGVVSPYYPKTDKPMIVIPSRDQHALNFNLDDLKIEFRDGTYCIHKSFFVVDRTGKEYKKRIPTYIVQQALDTISKVPEHTPSQQA